MLPSVQVGGWNGAAKYENTSTSSVYFEGDGDQGDPRARLPTFIKNSRRVLKQEAPY